MAQKQTKEKVSKKRKLPKSTSTSRKWETRSTKKQGMEKSVSSKGHTVAEMKRKSMDESQEKEKEKEDIMSSPKRRVKQMTKKSKFYPATLDKSTMFYPFISGVVNACLNDIFSKKKLIKESGLNSAND